MHILLLAARKSDIVQLFHTFLGDSHNYQPRGAVDYLMNSASGDSSSGGLQHLEADRLLVRSERYDLVVLLPPTHNFQETVFF